MEKIIKAKEKFQPIFHKKNGTTVIMWDYEPSYKEGSELPYGHCYQVILPYKATEQQVYEYICGIYNKEVDAKILSGMTYNGHMVWLSNENQMNYQSMFNLACQTNGANLPEKVKLGTIDEPYVLELDTLDKVVDFYSNVHKYISDCVAEGWEKKFKLKQ